MTNVVALHAAPTRRPGGQTAAELVAVGARLLDLTAGSADRWWKAGVVDLTTLDQVWPNQCVLAQTFGGNWVTGLQVLFPRLTLQGQYVAAERAGFWVRGGSEDVTPRYVELTSEWRAAIVARRVTWR